MSKIKQKTPDNKKIAKEILKYWRGTYTKDDLKKKLTDLFDTSDKKDAGGMDTGKAVEVDFVFDTDLDNSHRLVWLAIPAPDPRSGETVQEFIDRYHDSLGSSDQDDVEEKLGSSVLFGCGR